MKKYKVAQLCEQELHSLDTKADKSKEDQLKQKHALALATAVEGISKLNHKDMHKKLREWAAKEADARPTLLVGRGEQFISSTDNLFWFSCFVRESSLPPNFSNV